MIPLKRIALIHVPKCAGMAVGRALRETYFSRRRRWTARLRHGEGFRTVDIDAHASTRTARALGRTLPEVRATLLHYHLQDSTIGYVSGHVPFTREIGEDFADEWHFVTILRNPVDRFISEYLYNRYKPQDHFSISEDVEPFLETPEARRLGSQLVNFLTGRADVYTTPTGPQVRAAVENLEYFSVVGVTERMTDFASGVKERFGRSLTIGRENRSPAPEEARVPFEDPVVMKRIEELNEGDAEVYERAIRLVEE